jgi:hypothetical protein
MTGILPRSLIGTPEPPASRRRLMRVGVLLSHEVGVKTSPTGRYRSAMPEHVLSDARAAATYGISAGKTWEYNYMLGRDGTIFEQAGEFMGAHCLNFNPDSVGVIWLNATDEPPTPAQIDSWWWLRDHLVEIGLLDAMHLAVPHYRYRTTGCCGILAEPPGQAWNSPTGQGRLGNLIPALLEHPSAYKPPQEEDDMTATLWRHPAYKNVFLIGAGPALNVSSGVYDSYKERGAPVIVEAHSQMLKACLAQSGLTEADLEAV